MKFMKKLTVLAVSALLLAGMLSMSVFAAEAESVDVDLTEILEEFEDSGIEGRFENIEGAGISLFIPDMLEKVELNEEEISDGFLASFRSGENQWEVSVLSVGYADSLEELAELMDEEKMEYSVQDFNGGEVIVYLSEEHNAAFVLMENEKGGLTEVGFLPADDDDFLSLAEMMLFTIRPAYVLNWEDCSPEEDGDVTGSFRRVEDTSFSLWIPDDMAEAELSEQDLKQGYLAYYMEPDEERAVAVQRVAVSGLEMFMDEEDKDGEKDNGFSLDRYKNILTYFEAENVSDYIINGMPALYYELPEYSTASVSFIDKDGYMAEISFYPVPDDDFAPVVSTVMASIRKSEIMNWEDAEPFIEKIGLDGDFVTFEEAGVRMWMPDFLEPSDELDDIRDAGYVGLYTDRFEEAVVAVLCGQTDKSVEEFAEYAKESGASNEGYIIINGKEAFGYDLEENDVTALTFIDEDGRLVEISFHPYPDDEYIGAFVIMAASIMFD